MNPLPSRCAVVFCAVVVQALVAAPALAADPPPGYLEPVIQWGVQKGETCEDISTSLYGSPVHAGLVLRYNRVDCTRGKTLPEGRTLILPEKVTTIPDAKLRSVNPDVRARPSGGAWTPAASGMPLYSNASVNSLKQGRADVEFVDHTRIFLAENTLVVIYGTAARTKVSKTPPPIIEVQEGELRAGIAALRGEETIDIGVSGGGRVNASSRDAVVERKGDRTTVSVFDGKANVSSAGKTVSVPKNHGTRFVGATPPAPPRPLPPAPDWEAGSSPGVVLAPEGKGLLHVGWKPVAGALRYRLEVARDPGFHDLSVRQEVPGEVVAFRAEGQPPGRYYLTVRAIDKEEYLGIASTVRMIEVVETRWTGARGSLDERSIEANPYAVLEFAPSPGVELALDGGPFGPMLSSIDLARRAPSALRFRPRGTTDSASVTVRYLPVKLDIRAKRVPTGVALDVKTTGLEGIDVASRVDPRARLRVGEQVVEAKLTVLADRSLVATVPFAGTPTEVRIDVVDRNGKVLGSSEVSLEDAPAGPQTQAAPAREDFRPLGVTAPLLVVSSSLDVPWWSPTAPEALTVSGTADLGNPRNSGQLTARGSGRFGAFGFDGTLTTSVYGRSASDSAWLGGRYRFIRSGASVFEQALALRVGIPLSAAAPGPRFEPSLALGGATGRFTWLGNVGARVLLDDEAARRVAPTLQGFVLAGGTADLLPWLRASALLDAHLAYLATGDRVFGRGGLGVGLEAGKAFFGGVSARVSPWNDEGGLFSVQLALGLREPWR